MKHIFDVIMIPMQAVIIFFTLYYFIIALFGMWRKKEKITHEPQKKFAVIIPAHNEENVVGQLIDSLFRMNYPRHLYEVFVVADNCADRTADIARQHGVNVHERVNLHQRGKGYAMEWMFARLFNMREKFDAVVVFDADNLVDPNFLTVMNDKLCKGERVIQCYLDAKNPHDTWISATFAISFWVVNHIWHLAKYHLGLSSVLGGTGMCIATEILYKFGWGATCLTEDMEFTMKVLLRGIPTCWAHDAIVYDEKPLTFMQAWNQRRRWAQGHFDVASRYIPRLIQEGIRRRDIRLLDGVLHLLQPHFLLLSTVFVICSYIYTIIPFYTNIFNMVFPVQVWNAIAIGQYAFPFIVLGIIRAKWQSWLYALVYPIFIYSWIPITVLGFIYRKRTDWSHTQHTRNLSYEDVIMPSVKQQAEFSKENLLTKQAAK